jgi:DNA invertase Pin-like site-specific DNA recombinase
MGRLTFNVLLSFAQFEREVIGERIRDKIAAGTLASAAGLARSADRAGLCLSRPRR